MGLFGGALNLIGKAAKGIISGVRAKRKKKQIKRLEAKQKKLEKRSSVALSKAFAGVPGLSMNDQSTGNAVQDAVFGKPKTFDPGFPEPPEIDFSNRPDFAGLQNLNVDTASQDKFASAPGFPMWAKIALGVIGFLVLVFGVFGRKR